jgi:Zn-dependent protease
MNNPLFLGFQLIVLIFSVMIHEIAHGAVALKLGDTTAKDAGRLTLNPLKHIDPFGSVILPLLLVLAQSPFLIGWAKPVPYNPFNLKNPKKGAGIIGAAGPLSNLVIAVVFGIIFRGVTATGGAAMENLAQLIFYIILINILLAVFNLLPLPPLDGSNVLFSFLPHKYYALQEFLLRYGMFILLFFIFFGFTKFLWPIVLFLTQLLIGG